MTIKDFKVIHVDEEIAKRSATLRSRYHIPMVDFIIAATGAILNAPIITDDEHIVQVSDVKSRWIL
ncbi:MAG: PIN domain-containing protein [Candidatus Geothermarchaeales archaeon]